MLPIQPGWILKVVEQAPSFADIADALLETVRWNAQVDEMAEPFMAKVPVVAPGIAHTFARIQRRWILVAEGQRLITLMIPSEAVHRVVIDRWPRP